MMMTSVSSTNVVFDPRQTMQIKANEKSPAEELNAEEQQQVETASTPKISTIKSPADVRMLQIHQAAEFGILRPIWQELLEMDPDMPRTSDIIRHALEKKDDDFERTADETESSFKSEQTADEAERAFKSNRVADETEHSFKSGQTGGETESSFKSGQTADSAEQVFKSA